MERRIRLHSESLVEELARRDELDFAKEQRNQFIWLLLRVQKRRHQLTHQLQRQQIPQLDESCRTSSTASVAAGVRCPSPPVSSSAATNLKVEPKFVGVHLHFFCYVSTISRFGECFRDGQCSLVSFLFAVLLLTVPHVPSHLEKWGYVSPPPCPIESAPLQDIMDSIIV